MKALIVGTGGVGESMAQIAQRRDPKGEWLEKMVLADYDLAKAQAAAAKLNDPRFVAEKVDAGNPDEVAALAKKHDVDIICNLCAPEFNPQLLQAALKAQTHYLDTAMTVSEPHPEGKIGPTRVKLGDHEFPLSPEFEKIGKLALAGFGVEPGMADYFARYAADHFFDEIEEIGIRDGSNLEIPGAKGISFGFSIWTTIEECTQPAIIWEEDKGWYTVEPFAELEMFFLPEGIGEVEIAHVEHEEVINLGRSAAPAQGQQEGHLQVRARRRVHGGHGHLQVDQHRQEEAHQGEGRRGGAARRHRRRRPRPQRDRQEVRGPDGRRHLGARQEGRHGPRDVPVPDRRQPGVRAASTAPRSSSPRPPSRRSSPSSCWPPASCRATRATPRRGVHVPEEFSADDFVGLMHAYEFPGGLLEMDSEYKRHQRPPGLTAPLGRVTALPLAGGRAPLRGARPPLCCRGTSAGTCSAVDSRRRAGPRRA